MSQIVFRLYKHKSCLISQDEFDRGQSIRARNQIFVQNFSITFLIRRNSRKFTQTKIFALEYVKACGEEIRPLIRDALQVLHRLEFADSTPYQSANILTRPRLPHQVLLAVGGWSGGSPTNTIEGNEGSNVSRAQLNEKWFFSDKFSPICDFLASLFDLKYYELSFHC